MTSEPTINDAPPLKFSLRTVFFATTCVAVTLAGYKLSASEGDSGMPGALLFLGCFLTLWSLGTKRFALALLVFVPLAIYALLPQTGSRPVAPHAICAYSMRSIGEALLAYEHDHGSLPPAYTVDSQGKPLHSWRTLIMPYIDRADVLAAMKLDKPWNDPANKRVAGIMIEFLTCPSDQPLTTQTNYVALIGPNTAWPGSVGRKLAEIKRPSKTILVIEVADSGIQWAEPRDLHAEDLTSAGGPASKPLVLSRHRHANALFADGHVEPLPDDIDPQTLAAKFDVTNPP
jgi:prepilin-type processing-associated H-X9-DG protein